MYCIKDNVDTGKTSWLFGLPGSAPYPPSWDISAWFREACDKRTFITHTRCVSTPYQDQSSVMTFPEVDDPRMPPGKQVGDVYGYIYPHMSQGHLEGGNPNIAEVDRDYRLWCYRNWIKHAGLKGMYFDETQPMLAANPKAGMGYALDLPDRPQLDGKIQPGYGVTGIHDLYKRLRALFFENGVDNPYVWIHSTDANMVSAFAFAGYFLDGENEPRPTREFPMSEKIPPARQQAMRSCAMDFGFTQLEMIYVDDPLVWRDARGWLILHDVQGCQIGACRSGGVDLFRKADFLPYWSPKVAKALKTGNPEVYASAWRQDNGLRVLVFNRNATPVKDVRVEIDTAALGLAAAAGKSFKAIELEPKEKPETRGTGEPKAETRGDIVTVTVPVLERNYRMFWLGHTATPDTVPGLKSWYVADKGFDGATWKDQGPAGINLVQPEKGKRPAAGASQLLNGRPAVRFKGLFQGGAAMSFAKEALIEPAPPVGFCPEIYRDAPNALGRCPGSQRTVFTAEVYRDGNNQPHVLCADEPPTQLDKDGRALVNRSNYDYELAEIIVFDRKLNDVERRMIWSYLVEKYQP